LSDGFLPAAEACGTKTVLEATAVKDWNLYLANLELHEKGLWDKKVNLEANGYMYCFCEPKWLAAFLDPN